MQMLNCTTTQIGRMLAKCCNRHVVCMRVDKHKDGNVNAPTANWQLQEFPAAAAATTA